MNASPIELAMTSIPTKTARAGNIMVTSSVAIVRTVANLEPVKVCPAPTLDNGVKLESDCYNVAREVVQAGNRAPSYQRRRSLRVPNTFLAAHALNRVVEFCC